MVRKKRASKSGDLAYRIESIKALFTSLEKEIEALRQTGEIAQPGCWIVRYQARGTGGTYWYYKWQSHEPIFVTFVTKEGKPEKLQTPGQCVSPNINFCNKSSPNEGECFTLEITCIIRGFYGHGNSTRN